MSPARMKKIALYLEWIAFVICDEAKKAEKALEHRKKRRQSTSKGERHGSPSKGPL